jgi:hypothetical protein
VCGARRGRCGGGGGREGRLAAAMPAPACLLSPCAPPLPTAACLPRLPKSRWLLQACPSPHGPASLFENSQVLAVVVPPVKLHTAPMVMKLGGYPGLVTDGLWCKGLALTASIGQTVAPFSDGCPSGNQTLFTNSHVLAVVVPPVKLHTAPMVIKLGGYPWLGTDGLWCKGLTLSPRQSARRSPHLRIFGW